MKEFVEKLIGRLEEYKYSHLIERDSEMLEHCKEKEMDCEGSDCFLCVWDKATEIVNQLAEEYEQTIDVADLVEKYGQENIVNDGWIPVEQRLPEEKENPVTFDYMQYPVMVNIGGTVDLRYYYYGDGHWRYGFNIMDQYVTHWMDIKPYQPKGE